MRYNLQTPVREPALYGVAIMRSPNTKRVFFTVELKSGTLSLAEMSDRSFSILRDGEGLAGLSWNEQHMAVIAYEKMRHQLQDDPAHALKKIRHS